MRRVFALALREVAERKLLFLGAALIAVITLLVPLTPIPGGYAYRDVVDTGAFVFALLLMAGGGVVLGATTIGRDLSSGRIAFFFTRELAAWEIWSGRILGMFATVLLTAAVVLTPATMIGGGLRHLWDARADREFPVAIVFALLLPLAAHYVSVALRSRSAWLALDVVAACAALGVAWTLTLPFVIYWVNTPEFLGALFALLTIFLALAGWVGLAKGRITPVAVHRWSAFTLWSLVAAALLAFAGWRAWVFSVSPKELDWSKGWAYEIDGNGEWVGLGSGEKKGRGGIPHEFLMSTKTGAWMRIDETQGVAISADRRVAAIASRSWNWRPPRWVDTTMQLVDLTAAKPKARDLGIVLPELIWSAPALSADGSRLAIVGSKQVMVYSLPDEKLLASFPRSDSIWAKALFRDDATLLLASNLNDVTTIRIYDVDNRRRVSELVFPGGRFRIDSSAMHVAIGTNTAQKSGTIAIHQLPSGAKVGEFPYVGGSYFGRRFHWLANGGFANATVDDADPRVTIHAIDGSEQLRVPLPGAKRIAMAGEQRPGELIFVWSDNENFTTPCAAKPRVVAIDTASGATRTLGIEAWPKSWSFGTTGAPGSVSTRLFATCNGKFVLLDAASGAQRELLAGK